MDFDMLIVQRQGYTILDILAEVGGLQGFLFQVSSFLLSILNFNSLDSYLISKLYKHQRDGSQEQLEIPF